MYSYVCDSYDTKSASNGCGLLPHFHETSFYVGQMVTMVASQLVLAGINFLGCYESKLILCHVQVSG